VLHHDLSKFLGLYVKPTMDDISSIKNSFVDKTTKELQFWKSVKSFIEIELVFHEFEPEEIIFENAILASQLVAFPNKYEKNIIFVKKLDGDGFLIRAIIIEAEWLFNFLKTIHKNTI
jgi:hypothetical protein